MPPLPNSREKLLHEGPKRAHGRAVRRVLWLTLVLNLVSAALKFTVGAATRNLTVVSDAVHSLLDAGNNLMGLGALTAAERPPDRNHPYGHRKYEAVASLAIGGVMTLTSWEILKVIWGRYRAGTVELPIFNLGAGGLVLVSAAISLFIAIYEHKRGRALGSPLLVADAAHTRSDVGVSVLSVASLALAPRWPVLDATLALGIVLFIVYTAWTILRENMLLLTDAAVLDPEPVRAVVEAVEGVQNCHAIRSHGMPTEVHLDLHIVVQPELTAQRTHEIEMAVHRTLLEEFPQVAEVSIHHQTRLPAESEEKADVYFNR